MILDPSRDGIEVFYDDKIRNLTGDPEKCVDWIVKMLSDKLDYDSSKELYDKSDLLFNYKGDVWVQYTIPYLDTIGIGRFYVDLFDRIGFTFKKVDVKRIEL